jgi:hypothetical protein
MGLRSLPAGGILLSLLATMVPGKLVAQEPPDLSRPRLLSPSEGETIVLAAWELRHGLPAKPDCSHFVHAIYTKAGFGYEYAQSADLFEGIDSFQRVKVPQAGDLVVWQGHVGIVVDPAEHSFYSSVISGFAIEDYRSHYWIGRGTLRFYRYLVDAARGASLTARASAMPSSAKPQADAVVEPGFTASVPERHREAVTANPPPESRSRYLETDESEAETRDVVFVSMRDKPAKNEVLAAIVGTVDGRAAALAESIHLESARQVVVAESFNVVELKFKKDSGWAEVEVQQRAAFRFGSADPTPVTNRWRMSLSKQEHVWVLLVPRSPLFLRHEVARTVLARHLATLPGGNKREREKVQHILDGLTSREDTAELESASH